MFSLGSVPTLCSFTAITLRLKGTLFQNILTATHIPLFICVKSIFDAGQCFKIKVKEFYFMFLSLPDAKKRLGIFNIQVKKHESLRLHQQTVNKLVRFGFLLMVHHHHSKTLVLPNHLFFFVLHVLNTQWVFAEWLYFISCVFTVTMTALTFRQNSRWFALPFVRLLLGTNRHDCNQTFLFIY